MKKVLYKMKHLTLLGAKRCQADDKPEAMSFYGPKDHPGITPVSVQSLKTWGSEVPRPSKVAVILFYMSLVLTVIGTIVVIRTAFFISEDDGKPVALGVGLCMATAGMALIAITNVINKMEHDRIMRYLKCKIEELRSHENYGKMPNHVEDCCAGEWTPMNTSARDPPAAQPAASILVYDIRPETQ